MNGIDELLPLVPSGTVYNDLRNDLQLTHLEAMREMYEQKRDYYQLLMDTTDKMIQEIHKRRQCSENRDSREGI